MLAEEGRSILIDDTNERGLANYCNTKLVAGKQNSLDKLRTTAMVAFRGPVLRVTAELPPSSRLREHAVPSKTNHQYILRNTDNFIYRTPDDNQPFRVQEFEKGSRSDDADHESTLQLAPVQNCNAATGKQSEGMGTGRQSLTSTAA